MNTPEQKTKMRKMKKPVQNAEKNVPVLRKKTIEKLTMEKGENEDSVMHAKTSSIMNEKTEETCKA